MKSKEVRTNRHRKGRVLLTTCTLCTKPQTWKSNMVSLCKQNLIFVSFCLLQPHEKTWHFTENCNQTNYVMENLKTFKLGMTKLEKTKKNVVRVAVHKCDEKLGVNFAFRGCWVRISAVTILLVSSLASWQELWLELFADDITDLVCMKLPPRSPAVYRGRRLLFW